ncbi:MAG: class I SAM-dependent methyltransferase [Vulcanimicrobiaceae bacterium]
MPRGEQGIDKMAAEEARAADDEYIFGHGRFFAAPGRKSISLAVSNLQGVNDLEGMNPQSRFANRADDYAKYRPSYPAAAVDWIFHSLGDPRKLRVADIGSGTGISARLLADRGCQVVAVDPNPDMVAHARRHTRVRYLEARAESTGLPAASFNIVTCFQAFHWLQRDVALQEFGRILKPYGRVCVLWNTRESADPFMAAYDELIGAFGEDAGRIHDARQILSPSETFGIHGFIRVARAEFSHFHRMDLASFVGYARSCSYLPREGAAYERLRTGLEALYRQFADADGYVVFPYRTTAYRGDRVPRGAL